MTGVDVTDFALSTTGGVTGTIDGVTTSDNVSYTVKVNGLSGEGPVSLDIELGGIVDMAGNPLPAAFSSGDVWTRSLSADAALAALVPSAGSLDPAFEPTTTAYAVSVDNATTSITLTPTAAEPNATITVNGQLLNSGTASQPIALAVGSNSVSIIVTAENQTTATYTVTVTRVAEIAITPASLPDGGRGHGLWPRNPHRQRRHRAL